MAQTISSSAETSCLDFSPICSRYLPRFDRSKRRPRLTPSMLICEAGFPVRHGGPGQCAPFLFQCPLLLDPLAFANLNFQFGSPLLHLVAKLGDPENRRRQAARERAENDEQLSASTRRPGEHFDVQGRTNQQLKEAGVAARGTVASLAGIGAVNSNWLPTGTSSAARCRPVAVPGRSAIPRAFPETPRRGCSVDLSDRLDADQRGVIVRADQVVQVESPRSGSRAWPIFLATASRNNGEALLNSGNPTTSTRSPALS